MDQAVRSRNLPTPTKPSALSSSIGAGDGLQRIVSTRLAGPSWSAHQLQRLRQLREQLVAEFRADVKERQACEAVRAILPGVMGTSLDDHIALLQRYLAVIQDEDHL